MAAEDKRSQGPDCYKCRYFQITYEKRRPYACAAMGFKSRNIPSLVVLRTSQQPCMAFAPKPDSWPGWRKDEDKRLV